MTSLYEMLTKDKMPESIMPHHEDCDEKVALKRTPSTTMSSATKGDPRLHECFPDPLALYDQIEDQQEEIMRLDGRILEHVQENHSLRQKVSNLQHEIRSQAKGMASLRKRIFELEEAAAAEKARRDEDLLKRKEESEKQRPDPEARTAPHDEPVTSAPPIPAPAITPRIRVVSPEDDECYKITSALPKNSLLVVPDLFGAEANCTVYFDLMQDLVDKSSFVDDTQSTTTVQSIVDKVVKYFSIVTSSVSWSVHWHDNEGKKRSKSSKKMDQDGSQSDQGSLSTKSSNGSQDEEQEVTVCAVFGSMREINLKDGNLREPHAAKKQTAMRIALSNNKAALWVGDGDGGGQHLAALSKSKVNKQGMSITLILKGAVALHPSAVLHEARVKPAAHDEVNSLCASPNLDVRHASPTSAELDSPEASTKKPSNQHDNCAGDRGEAQAEDDESGRIRKKKRPVETLKAKKKRRKDREEAAAITPPTMAKNSHFETPPASFDEDDNDYSLL